MKRIVSILIFSCITLLTFAQEKIIFDTIPNPAINKGELLFEQPLILDNALTFGKLNLIDYNIFNQPLIPD